jgi:head-tail adaptor
MDRRVIIENYITSNDFGTVTKTYATWNTVWAAKMHKSITENEEANKETAMTTVEYFIRYLSGVQKDFRLVDEYGNYYDIIGVEEIGRRRYTRLTCKMRE